MSSLAIDELKSRLNALIQALDTGATTPEIIANFRKLHAKTIVKARVELEDMGLTKVVNSVGNRRPLQFAGEPDLFSGFAVPNAIVIRDEEGRLVHIPIGKASIAEAKIWANSPKKPPQPTAHQIEVQRLIDGIEPYAENESTLVEAALHASKSEEQREKK